jgi:SP family facilitated glucose/fructose transporter-like MFS transporter 5
MACGLIPTYLYEVSPSQLRGSTGVIQQLFLTIGIVISQVLGFRQILG